MASSPISPSSRRKGLSQKRTGVDLGRQAQEWIRVPTNGSGNAGNCGDLELNSVDEEWRRWAILWQRRVEHRNRLAHLTAELESRSSAEAGHRRIRPVAKRNRKAKSGTGKAKNGVGKARNRPEPPWIRTAANWKSNEMPWKRKAAGRND